jgi:hypothetical protein
MKKYENPTLEISRDIGVDIITTSDTKTDTPPTDAPVW